VPIIEGNGGILGVAGSKEGRRFIQLSFDMLETDFPLHVGFPIFITNCLDWLVPPASDSGESYRTGSPVYLEVPPSVSRLTVTDPAGGKQVINVTQTPVLYDNTSRLGVYQVKGKGISREFACNLSSSLESDTSPKDAVIVGTHKFTASSHGVRTNRELYGPLLLLALAVLMFEWYAYHRRI
jgi:hypothetical protein